MKVLFVCLGNICRSPAAEGIFRHLCQLQGTQSMFVCDSAGTAAYHIGKGPDPRMCQAAQAKGIMLDDLRARQVSANDFYDFDLLVAMDNSNLSNLQAIKPADATAKLVMMLDYPSAPMSQVPDPYYGGAEGFDQVLSLLQHACSNLHELYCQVDANE
ncbi:MAG: low molecular weight phosphotyrosine protein phosphatase [Gammaproteobacteria bacterium]|nr:low molecular weight phosphotyrosine protein phosphatase [Gammaproteobacteria bacterium]MCP4879941.1 low molecular weight phosphotyrosine protein phosphatase [Gammaproteobacteria bacterium]